MRPNLRLRVLARLIAAVFILMSNACADFPEYQGQEEGDDSPGTDGDDSNDSSDDDPATWTVWRGYPYGPNLYVWIDDVYVANLTTYFLSTPECGTSTTSAVTVEVSAFSYHEVYAEGTSYYGDDVYWGPDSVYFEAGDCHVSGLAD